MSSPTAAEAASGTSETERADGAVPDEPGRGRHATKPSEVPAKGWKDVGLRVVKEMQEDNVPLAAAGVAFYGFLAAVPALAALVSIYGLFATPRQVGSRVNDLFGALPEDARRLLSNQLKAIAGGSSAGLSLTAAVGILLSLWSASSGMAHLMQAVNLAYGEKHTRKFLKQRAMALGLTVGSLVVVIAAVTAMTVFPAALGATSLPTPLRALLNVAGWLVLALLFVVGLSVLFRYSPERDEPKWRWVTPGALVGLALWVTASVLFQVYAANFSSYNKTYGALAGVVLLLMWLFLSGLAVLVAAEINAELEHQTQQDTTTGPPQPLGERNAEMADTVGPSADALKHH